MAKDWSIGVCLWECKTLYGEYEKDQMLPFLPRVGDCFLMSDMCMDELIYKVRECIKKHDCGNGCPFVNDNGEVDISDEVTVHEVLFDVKEHFIGLTLRKDGVIYSQYEID